MVINDLKFSVCFCSFGRIKRQTRVNNEDALSMSTGVFLTQRLQLGHVHMALLAFLRGS